MEQLQQHQQLLKLLEREKSIMREKWKEILERQWKVVEVTQFHRTKRVDVVDIDSIKQVVYGKLGSIVPFIFLNEFYSHVDHVGNIRNVEKGLLILFRFLTGKSIPEMSQYMPKSSYSDIEMEFFKTHGESLSTWIDTMNNYYFTTPKLRLISAKLFNPPQFEHITLYLDGMDTRINYNSQKEIDGFRMERSDLYGWKFKKSGGRTQIIIDTNNFFYKFSHTAKAGTTNDGAMFQEFKPDRYLVKSDVLCSDGGYTLHIDNVLEDNETRGGGLSRLNFCNPIRKINNTDFKLDEVQYNEKFGSFRSKIETAFSNIGSTFLKFSSLAKHRISNWNVFNLQLRFVCLLLNIRTAISFFNLDFLPRHGQWRYQSFDFPERDSFESEEHTARVEEALDRSRLQRQYQDRILDVLLQELEEEQNGTNNNETSIERQSLQRSPSLLSNDEDSSNSGYGSEELSTPRPPIIRRRNSIEETPEEIHVMQRIAKNRRIDDTQEDQNEGEESSIQNVEVEEEFD